MVSRQSLGSELPSGRTPSDSPGSSQEQDLIDLNIVTITAGLGHTELPASPLMLSPYQAQKREDP